MTRILANNLDIFSFFTNPVSNNISIKWNEIMRLFLIQTPVKSDAGEYKCSVKNKWGTDYTTFQLG